MHNLRQIFSATCAYIAPYRKSDTHSQRIRAVIYPVRPHARNIPFSFFIQQFGFQLWQIIETNYVSIQIKVTIVDARETIVELICSSIGIKCSMRWNKNEYQILREISPTYRQYRNNVAAPGRHWLDYAVNYVQREMLGRSCPPFHYNKIILQDCKKK